MKIGFHLPIAGGFEKTYREARRLGCEVGQIFVKNPRSWSQKMWSAKDKEDFQRFFHDLPVIGHLSYLPNIARADEDGKSRDALMHEAALCAEVGINSLVVHCGSREDREKGLEIAAATVEEVLAQFPMNLLLESAAGQGNVIGKDIDELIAIHRQVRDSERLGFCLDTAHLFESGYDVRKKAAWQKIFSKIEKACGLDALRFFHLNDSKTLIGSKVDRHWHIGQGEIGLECFRYLLNEKKIAHLGGVMETPKMGNMDEQNMKVMRSLLPPLVSRSLS